MTITERLNKAPVSLTNVAVALLLIRLFLAFEWLNSGTGKIQSILANPSGYFGGLSKVFATVWTKGNPYPFMTDFLTNSAAPNASVYVTAIAITEVLVALSLLLGLLSRLGAFGGIVMNAIFILAAGHTSPSTMGINVIMIGAQLGMIAAPGGRILGVDAVLHRKFAKIPLW